MSLRPRALAIRVPVAAALAALTLAGCGGNGNSDSDANASGPAACLEKAGLTVAHRAADLRALPGLDQGIPPVAVGTAAVNATSYYNDSAKPPWELVLIYKPPPGKEEADPPRAQDTISHFEQLTAAAYSRPRDEHAVSRAFDDCVS
jgi:hypothetical protein